MNERDERERNTPPGESRDDSREEKLQSLFTAAYLPLDPSEALVRRVAAVVAEREAQEVRRRRWWSLPFGWGSAVGAVAAAALLIALGWTLLRGHHGRARQLSPPSVALSPRLPRNPPGPRPFPHAPRHDQAPLIASLPPVPEGPAVAVPHPPQSVPIHGAQPTTGKRSPLHPRQPQPAVSGPPAPAGDDMAFVNPVPETIIRGWAPMPVSDWERIEARVRRNVRVKEDFVRIPFPRIASTSTRQIVAAVEQYKREAAIVDPRLSREVTLAVKGAALSDVCDQLQAQTGIPISAGRSVADEKVTIFCEKTPLRQVMREINHLFGDTWLRSRETAGVEVLGGVEVLRKARSFCPSTPQHPNTPTPPAGYRYELEQDLRSQLLEEDLRNRDRDAALLALDAQMQQYRPYLELSFDELEQRAAQNPEVRRLLFQVMRNAGWAGMQLYYRLTPAQRAALVAGQTLIFRSDAADPDRRLPAEWQRPVLRSWSNVVSVEGKLTQMAEVPGLRVNQVWLKLRRSELSQVTLACGATAGPSDPLAAGLTDVGPTVIATGQSPSVADPGNAKANAVLRGEPPFDRILSLRPEPSCPRLKRGKPSAWESNIYSASLGDMGQPHVFSGDVWEAVHRATGLPIVADYYTRMHRLDRVTVERKPLFEALCTAADAMGVRWRKEGDFLLCRSTRYFWDKLQEVPNRYLQRWTRDRDANGGLPLADFLEMASMPDAELDSPAVSEGIEHCWELPEWSYLHFEAFRREARRLNLLTPEQLEQALQPEGIPVTSLSQAQQRAALQFQLAADADAELQTGYPTGTDPGTWAKLSIYATYAPAGWYVWTPPRGPSAPRMPHLLFPTVGRTPAAAMAAARRQWPEAPEATVRQVGGRHFSVGTSPGEIDQAENGYFEAGVRYSVRPRPTSGQR